MICVKRKRSIGNWEKNVLAWKPQVYCAFAVINCQNILLKKWKFISRMFGKLCYMHSILVNLFFQTQNCNPVHVCNNKANNFYPKKHLCFPTPSTRYIKRDNEALFITFTAPAEPTHMIALSTLVTDLTCAWQNCVRNCCAQNASFFKAGGVLRPAVQASGSGNALNIRRLIFRRRLTTLGSAKA